MERIQAAIQKARKKREAPAAALPADPRADPRAAAPAGTAWAELAPFAPDLARMERNRIVTFADADPAHAAFDAMRAGLLHALSANGWTSVGITSPGPGCGKTTVALNLAFSLARRADLRTALVDLDLRRPGIAPMLGLAGSPSAARAPQGAASISKTFVRYGHNLAIGAGSAPMRPDDPPPHASTGEALAGLKTAFAPDVILCDLPPMLAPGDATAFLPHLDCVLLVVGAERSRLDDVDRCQRELTATARLLGVVLNGSR